MTSETRPGFVPSWARTASGIAFSDVDTAPGGRMPDFCIIGASKCATSSINQYLKFHPNLFMNPLKEPHYFSTEAIHARGDDWYRGLYAEARDGQLCGEASTSYSRQPLSVDVPQRLHAANPDMKLIYIVREPVARTQSDVQQEVKYYTSVLHQDMSDLPLDQVLDMLDDPDGELYTAPTNASRYIRQIEAFEAMFPRDRILVLLYEDAQQNMQGALDQIVAFLGLPPHPFDNLDVRINVTKTYIEGVKARRATRGLQKVPGYSLLKSALPEGLKTKLRRNLMKRQSVDNLVLSPKRRAAMQRDFAPENARLADWLGRDLSRVWKTS